MPRRKKRAAWGSLTQIDSTTWRLRYWSSGPDGYKRRSKTLRNATRLDAERARSELMLAHSEDAPCPTVGEVWDSYALPAYQRRVDAGELSPRTLRQFESVWANHIAPRWDGVQCDAVRPLHVQQWLDGMGLTTARQALTIMATTMDHAVRFELCAHNPMRERYLMPSASTVERRDEGVWTLPQLGEVWRAVRGTWAEAAVLLMAFGGLRVGESLGVRTEDVDVDVVDGVPLALVEVRRQVPNAGKSATERLKTPQSRRMAVVPGRAALRLLRLAADADGWLSGDGLGRPNSQRRLNAEWSRAELPERHPLHNLRNSWQTNMRWVMRVPPYFIEALMGHAVAGVTGTYYDRPDASMLARVVAEAYAERPYDAGWDWCG